MSDSGNNFQLVSGDLELDARAGELRRHGLTVRLPEQLFRLLALLTERSGQVVTREEIRGILWSDRFVNFDDSINSAIKRLRQCLEVSAMSPGLIKTLPGRGYRFTLPTEAIRPISRADGDTLDTREPRVVVLPFRDLSSSPAEEYLVASLTEAVVTALTKIPKLHVVSWRKGLVNKGAEQAPSTEGRMLNVDAVVRGTVYRSGNCVRVTVQLLDVATDEYLWADNFDHVLTDILPFHTDISAAIAERVSERLLPGTCQRFPSPVRPRRPAAYQAFLEGHHVFKNVTDEGLWKARHYWKKAVREDPNYAKAFAGLAESYNMLGITGLLPALDAMVQSREAATRALELDESLSEAHTALAFTRMVEWDWDGAGKEFRRAQQLDPNFATGNPCHYVEYLLATGRPETAIAELERAQEIHPLALFLSVILGWAFYATRQYDKAIREHRRVVAIEPRFGMAHWCLGMDYSQKRRYRAAIEEFQQARLLGGPHNAVSAIGYAYAMMGEKEKARHMLRELKRQIRTSYTPPYAFAAIHAGLGDIDAAFECLNQSCKTHDVGLVWLKWDPQFDNLRSDPRFQAILESMGLQTQSNTSNPAN